MSDEIVPWRPIEPLPDLNGEIVARLAAVDALQEAWKETQATASPAEVRASLERGLRRHAIETGIIERLYDMSWGVTEALVAEGLTTEVAATEGEVTQDTLAIIKDQFDALSYLVDWSRENHDLSIHFVRELHALIVRHQPTYEGRDQFGRTVSVRLKPGAWKELDNTITRSDGVVLQCAPPLVVEEEMRRLVDLYRETAQAHPLVRAAWLHHRFIQIHPFSDGNGRVARALTLLALQRAHFAPITVDRTQRRTYIAALDEANAGDLRPLVRLFASLEEKALRAELRTPLSPVSDAVGAVAVARAYASRLMAREVEDHALKARNAAQLAADLHRRLTRFLTDLSTEMEEAFRQFDPEALARVQSAAPPAPEARYWHGQLVHAARLSDFYANLSDGSWWVRIHLRVRGQLLRFIAAVQKVGRGETGVLALTVYAEVLDSSPSESERPAFLFRVFEHPNVPESVTFVHTDDAETRWPEVEQVVDDALSSAISRFAEHLA
ncbi:Fic family protein [Streptomyces sp. B1866]|uniref:Fic family protein n=1 Tax=Streptomyces sp. B1866 TaxID=3075431 RepID=UPI00288DAE43|nr:Fic family protein [Streptomyces sp. B1866]MDT3397150.1 Fic family protein [Streptomyces sp. B1866]